jgi:hypothetical protein
MRFNGPQNQWKKSTDAGQKNNALLVVLQPLFVAPRFLCKIAALPSVVMPERKRSRVVESKNPQERPGLSLKVESLDRSHPRVDADEFLSTAEKWLRALKAFAVEQGQQVKWEIVDLRKSSAFIEVQAVKVKNHKPATALIRKWDEGLRKIEKTGRPPAKFTPASISALKEFVSSVPKDAVVSLGNGSAHGRLQITALTQRRVEEAAQRLPQEPKREYVTQGSVRGRLAILDSWKPEQRFFSLQLPLAPNKPVKCTYRDQTLVAALGDSFEGTVEITGTLHYHADQPWPHTAEVENIRPLHPPNVGLKDLVGLIELPTGQDSVSYIRSVRDAE